MVSWDGHVVDDIGVDRVGTMILRNVNGPSRKKQERNG